MMLKQFNSRFKDQNEDVRLFPTFSKKLNQINTAFGDIDLVKTKTPVLQSANRLP